MSELKAEQWLDYSGEPNMCYPAKKVDEAIAELKAENKSLNGLLNVWNTYKILAEKIEELRATRRALWLARAERAASWQIHFSLSHNHSIKREFTINGASYPHEGMVTMRTARDWAMIWKNVERKCRAKAEASK